MEGTVVWFDAPKGFGFIHPDENSKDVFVHHTAINMEGYRKLRQGQRVIYDVELGPKGVQAVDVVPVCE